MIKHVEKTVYRVYWVAKDGSPQWNDHDNVYDAIEQFMKYVDNEDKLQLELQEVKSLFVNDDQ